MEVIGESGSQVRIRLKNVIGELTRETKQMKTREGEVVISRNFFLCQNFGLLKLKS